MSEIRRVRRWNSTLFVNFDPDANPKARKPVNRESSKHKADNRRWSRIKKQTIKEREPFDGSYVCCEKCGKPFVIEEAASLEGDHILARSKGGKSEKDNQALLCADCHRLGPNAKHGGKAIMLTCAYCGEPTREEDAYPEEASYEEEPVRYVPVCPRCHDGSYYAPTLVDVEFDLSVA